MNISISFSDSRRLQDAMKVVTSDEGRQVLHAAAAKRVAAQVQSHIRSYKDSKHETARRLGATPTGHYEAGARDISTNATAEQGTVTIPIPGIQRAFRDVTIAAKKANALTIPLDALSYGRRAGELKHLGVHLFPLVKNGKKTDILMGKMLNGEARPMYLLRKQVTQPQDASLLPTMDEIRATAEQAILATLHAALNQKGKLAS